MICRKLLICLVLFVAGMVGSTGIAASPPKMRPYTGIGLLVFSQSADTLNQYPKLPLYEEPGLSRVGVLGNSSLSGNKLFFDLPEGPPLIVSARKGEWLRVYYDDAGREAWIDPQNRGYFQTWEQFLKRQTVSMLSGLQQQYYHLQQKPGGKLLVTMSPKQTFRVLKVENAWVMVLTEQSQIGWLRWHDNDGRLTIGAVKN